MARFDLAPYLHRATNTLFASADYFFPSGRALARPYRFHLEFNDYCNLKCVQCPREVDGVAKNTGQWTMEMLEKIKPWLPWAGFVGLAGLGEPFIAKWLIDFMEECIRAGAAPSVITNGTLITKEKAERLAAMGQSLLNVSIDGATKATYEKIRIKGNFDEVVQNMTYLKEARERRRSPYPITSIYFCIMRDNLHEMKELADLGAKLGVPIVQTQPCYDYGQPNAREQIITNEEAEKAVAELRSYAPSRGFEVRHYPLNNSLPDAQRDFEANGGATNGSGNGNGHGANGQGNGHGKKQRYYCPNIWRVIHIDPLGNVRVCCMGDFENLGNINEQPMDEIWNSKAMRDIRKSLLDGNPPDCCRKCYLLERHTGSARDYKRNIKEYTDSLTWGNLMRPV